jgi:DNA-binding MarR family transcriptional regulator
MPGKDQILYANEYGPCACSQLRRAARKLSMLYDQTLQPAGITVTQYAVLINVARAGEISRTALAAQLGMDRTTLTRNLIPLEKSNLLVPAQSADRRERLIRLSKSGAGKVRQSFTLWQKAQQTFAEQMGPAKLKQFRSALEAAEAAAGTISESNH